VRKRRGKRIRGNLMDDETKKKKTPETSDWGTPDPALKEGFSKAKIPPKKFDPEEIRT
jgi:hypothetical protein